MNATNTATNQTAPVQVTLTHHGHACVELSDGSTSVLFDPGNFSDFAGVKGVDAIVVTHQHPDHLDMDQLDALRESNADAGWFAEPQTAAKLRDAGVEVTVTRAGQTYRVGDFTLEGVGSLHAEIHPYIDRITNVGMVVRHPNAGPIFHPGDSLEGRPEDVDVLCVPVTAPWQAVKETIEFVRAIKPKRLIPIHDKTASEAGRSMYLGHITSYGRDGGIELLDVPVGEGIPL